LVELKKTESPKECSSNNVASHHTFYREKIIGSVTEQEELEKMERYLLQTYGGVYEILLTTVFVLADNVKPRTQSILLLVRN